MRKEPEGGRGRKEPGQAEVRERVLDAAATLFYRHGVRAVGVDVVVEAACVAKTSLYRHFPSKDALIAAFLQREDADFWATWDRVAEQHGQDGLSELEAHMAWIGERVGRAHYRGCPQINVAAEFPEDDHPAREVARLHKLELRRRLRDLAVRLGVARPDDLAAQLTVVINGAFVSSQVLAAETPTAILLQLTRAVVGAACNGAGRSTP